MSRITSYNVCYTKLLRNYYISAHNLKFQLYYNNRNASGDNMALIGNKKITTNGGSVSALVQLMF